MAETLKLRWSMCAFGCVLLLGAFLGLLVFGGIQVSEVWEGDQEYEDIIETLPYIDLDFPPVPSRTYALSLWVPNIGVTTATLQMTQVTEFVHTLQYLFELSDVTVDQQGVGNVGSLVCLVMQKKKGPIYELQCPELNQVVDVMHAAAWAVNIESVSRTEQSVIGIVEPSWQVTEEGVNITRIHKLVNGSDVVRQRSLLVPFTMDTEEETVYNETSHVVLWKSFKGRYTMADRMTFSAELSVNLTEERILESLEIKGLRGKYEGQKLVFYEYPFDPTKVKAVNYGSQVHSVKKEQPQELQFFQVGLWDLTFMGTGQLSLERTGLNCSISISTINVTSPLWQFTYNWPGNLTLQDLTEINHNTTEWGESAFIANEYGAEFLTIKVPTPIGVSLVFDIQLFGHSSSNFRNVHRLSYTSLHDIQCSIQSAVQIRGWFHTFGLFKNAQVLNDTISLTLGSKATDSPVCREITRGTVEEPLLSEGLFKQHFECYEERRCYWSERSTIDSDFWLTPQVTPRVNQLVMSDC